MENEQELCNAEVQFLRAVHNRITNLSTKMFLVSGMLKTITRYLMRDSQCSLYLNKDRFEELYPVLKDMVLPENNVTLIVSKDVLQNEEIKNVEKLKLSELVGCQHIYVNQTPVTLPSFILINHRSFLLEVDQNDGLPRSFMCQLNAPFNFQQAKDLDAFYRHFSRVKMISTPLLKLEKEKQKIATQKIALSQNQTLHTLE